MVQDVCFKELKRADGSHEIATDVISGISRRKEATDSRHRPQKTRTRFDDEEGNSTRVHQQTLFILSSEFYAEACKFFLEAAVIAEPFRSSLSRLFILDLFITDSLSRESHLAVNIRHPNLRANFL